MTSGAASPPRNISKSLTFDRDRLDALERIARGLRISLSAAVARLVDLHAGAQLEVLEAQPAEVAFELERWSSRRLSRDLIVTVAGRVREGSTKADAYRSVQVPPKLGGSWEKKGRDDVERERQSIHADLVMSLERARAEFNMELLAEARRQADYKTLLKLMDPEQFTPPSRSTVDVTHRWQMLIDWDRFTLTEQRTLAYLLRKGSPAEDDPSVTRTARPALEAVPVEVLEHVDDVDEGEWTEAPVLDAGDEKPDP